MAISVHPLVVTRAKDGLGELQVAGLTLRGRADGGVETCLMVPELKLMFDIGRCPPGALRFGRLLASHGHADHLAGLPYWVSQRHLMRQGAPTVHFPAEIHAPLQRIFEGWREIEDFPLEVQLRPTAPGDRFSVGKELRAMALRSVHRVPSLAYVIERISKKLKPELEGKSGNELRDLKNAGQEITTEHATPILCVTGDTQIEFYLDNPIARRCSVLVHEVTAWDERRTRAQIREWGHTHVDEMIEHAEKFEGEALVLVHRSLRHSRRFAEAVVREQFPASVRDRVHVFE